jgi:hypothetical protein
VDLVFKIPSLNEDVYHGSLVDLMDRTVRGESVLKGKKHATFQFSNLPSASAQITTLSYNSERAPLIQLAASVDFLRPSLFGALNLVSSSAGEFNVHRHRWFQILFHSALQNERSAFDAAVIICYHFFSGLLVL